MSLLAIASFSTCLLLLLLLGPVAHRVGWVDRPSARKIHDQPVPVVGGVAIFLAVLFALSLFQPRGTALQFFLDLFPLVLLGLIDDVWHLRPVSRLIVQVALVTQLVLSHGVALLRLGDLFGFGEISLGWLSIPFTVFAFVGLLNSINLVDGMDGLAGGLVAIALSLLLFVAALLGLSGSAVALATATLAALLVFLVFNMRHPLNARARVFLGDAGSMLLGMILAAVLFKLTQRPVGGSMPAALALWIVAIPLLDTCSVMIRRLAHRENPFAGDRQHLHHLVMAAGFTHAQSVALILSVGLLMGLFPVLAWMARVQESALSISFVLLALAYLAWVFNPQRAVGHLSLLRSRFSSKPPTATLPDA